MKDVYKRQGGVCVCVKFCYILCVYEVISCKLIFQDGMEKKKPYCIAQYDYEAGHPDDLSFKVKY